MRLLGIYNFPILKIRKLNLREFKILVFHYSIIDDGRRISILALFFVIKFAFIHHWYLVFLGRSVHSRILKVAGFPMSRNSGTFPRTKAIE